MVETIGNGVLNPINGVSEGVFQPTLVGLGLVGRWF